MNMNMNNAGSDLTVKVLVLWASLRATSPNPKLTALAARLAKKTAATVDLASMRDFEAPSYDADTRIVSSIPKGAAKLRRRRVGSDASITAKTEADRAAIERWEDEGGTPLPQSDAITGGRARKLSRVAHGDSRRAAVKDPEPS
jgi:hypothetical protein